MTNKLKVMFSKNTDDWKTPSDIYSQFMNAGYIDCFPYQADHDEFDYKYYNKKLFINPPFSKLKFIPLFIEANLNNKIALLIPARTDTQYFHGLLCFNPIIYFIKGRLKYNDSKKSAPFPTILLIFDRNCSKHQYRSIVIGDLCNVI